MDFLIASVVDGSTVVLSFAHTFMKWFALSILPIFLVSCSLSPVASSRGRDALGHRPGPRGFKTVIIDAGHGGHDSGARSRFTGNQEKDLTLDMAKRVKSQLGSGYKTLLMRSDDTFVDLDERVARANRYGDAVLVSIHFNDGPPSVRGPETYYWRVDSYGLAKKLQSAMVAVSPAEEHNRGMVRRRLRLTRNPEIPCVLIECGYISHPAESALCANPSYRQKLASAIAQAIKQQAKSGDAGAGPLPPPIDSPLSRPSDQKE